MKKGDRIKAVISGIPEVDCYAFRDRIEPPNGFKLVSAKIPNFAKIFKKQLEEPAATVQVVRDKAEELNMDPYRSNIGSVLAMQMIVDTINGNTSSYAATILAKMDQFNKNNLTKPQVVKIARRIVEIITGEVHDPQVRAAISEKIAALLVEYQQSDMVDENE